MKFIVVLGLMIFCLAGTAAGQTRAFSEARTIPAGNDDYFDFKQWNFSIGADSYEIERDGKGRRKGANNSAGEFQISLEADQFIDRVIYFTEYKNDLILLAELENGDAGSGFFGRFDKKSLKPKWLIPIPAFNIAQGLIEENAAYLAAIGFAAKFDLETGKEIWKHEGFYRKYRETGAFNIFETPQIEGETVIYAEKSYNKNAPNFIVFNKTSGEVLEVSLN